ncbi:MAG TPA: hypothetical protein DCZ75_19695 [Geobacter sp.]|nr:hypothetical protein [Geobacter sp.]
METKRPLRHKLIPSVADLFFVTVLFSMFFTRTSPLLSDGDTGYHIRAGEHIIRTRSIPASDIFSLHTPPLPWTPHEWLSEVCLAAVHNVLGLTGVVAFSALLLAATSYLLFRILRSYRTNVLIAILVTLLAVSSSKIHWLARPHLFSLLLMVVFHYLIETWHSNRANRLYLLPLLMLLWVNLHGGFIAGFILLGAYLVGDLASLAQAPAAERKALLRKLLQLGGTTAATFAATLLNPSGYKILLFPFALVSDSYMMDHVNEFLSPNFHGWFPFRYLLLALIAILALSRKRLEPAELVLVIVFTNMSLYSARYIPLFALVTAPILTRKADETEGGGGRLARFFRERSRRVAELDAMAIGHLWPGSALLAVAAAIFSGQVTHAFDERCKPVAACEFLLRQKIPGNMFNNDEFGDYLIYRSYPAYRVFIDGRLDMYGSGRLKEYYRVTCFEPGWESVLEKYGVTWIMFDSNSALSRFLANDERWALIYSDRVASIFVKRIPQNAPLISRYRNVKQVIFAPRGV